MSNVNMLDCPICNLTVADAHGIRRTVVPTATELFNFIQHMFANHYTALSCVRDTAEIARKHADQAQGTADEALNRAKRMDD